MLNVFYLLWAVKQYMSVTWTNFVQTLRPVSKGIFMLCIYYGNSMRQRRNGSSYLMLAMHSKKELNGHALDRSSQMALWCAVYI
jgi:hypothetical protein